jgi:hypothetical protein
MQLRYDFMSPPQRTADSRQQIALATPPSCSYIPAHPEKVSKGPPPPQLEREASARAEKFIGFHHMVLHHATWCYIRRALDCKRRGKRLAAALCSTDVNLSVALCSTMYIRRASDCRVRGRRRPAAPPVRRSAGGKGGGPGTVTQQQRGRGRSREQVRWGWGQG